MKDQVSVMNERLLANTTKLSGLSDLGIAEGRSDVVAFLGMGQQDKSVDAAVRAGKYRIVLMTEKLLFGDDSASGGSRSAHTSWLEALAAMHNDGKLLLIAVDEAHCIVKDVESGCTGYRRLCELRALLPGLPMMALSAVATPAMWPVIRKTLNLSPDAIESYGSVYRENLLLSVRSKQPNTSKKGKKAFSFMPYIDEILKELRETGKVEPTIVYVHGRTGKPCSVAPQNHEHTTVSCCMCMRCAALPIGRSTFFAYLSSHFTLACAICPQKLRISAASCTS